MPVSTLRTKFLIGILGSLALLGFVVIGLARPALEEKLAWELQKRGVSIAKHIASNSITPVLTEKYFDLDMLLQEFKASDEDISYIFVTDRRGGVVSHTFEDGFPRGLDDANIADLSQKEYSVRRIVTEKGAIVDIAVPLLKGEAGELHLGISADGINRDVNAISRLIGRLLALTLLIAGVLTFIVSGLITGPLIGLTKMADRAARGDLNQRAAIGSNDEIGKLGTTFNRMITERRLAEERLKLALAYNRSLIEASLDPLVTIGPDGRITDVNSASEAVTGYPRDKLIGTDFSDYFTDPDRARAGYQQVFRDGVVHDYALEVKHSEGKVTPVLYNASVYRNEKGEIAGVFAAARDITERRKKEEELGKAYHELEHSLGEKEVLLGEVHHRVKNNMQTLISILKLQAAAAGDKKVSDLLSESQDRIRAMSLVHEKLFRTKDFAHIPYDSYIRDLTTTLMGAYSIAVSGVALEMDIEDIALDIDTAMYLGLIINELVTNSLKHAFPSGRSGAIKICLKKPGGNGGFFELRVSDNGVGLPDALDFRKTKTMGLFLVTNLVESQLQGQIELNRNNGTEYRIRFRKV